MLSQLPVESEVTLFIELGIMNWWEVTVEGPKEWGYGTERKITQRGWVSRWFCRGSVCGSASTPYYYFTCGRAGR